jgi:pilus assembly protein CpaF
MDLPTQIIEQQIASALDLIVMSHRFADGVRLITTLSEVEQGQSGGVVLNECVHFDEVTRGWILRRRPGFVSQAQDEGLLDAEEVDSWASSFS